MTELPALEDMPGTEMLRHAELEHALSEAAGSGLVNIRDIPDWHERDHAWRAQGNAPPDAVTHRHRAPVTA